MTEGDPGRGAPEDLQVWVAQLKIAFGHPDSTKGWAAAAEVLRPLVEARPAHEELVAALRAIAEGNLGPTPWQANYDQIREVARAALAKAERR